MIIRRANKNDGKQILNLLNELGYKITTDQDFKSTLSVIFSRDDLSILVADTGDDRLAGYIFYSIKPLLRLVGLSMEIDELSVSANHRGQKVGTALLNEAKKEAQLMNVKRIILSTNRERESYKRGFYEKYGFSEKNSAWLCLDLVSS